MTSGIRAGVVKNFPFFQPWIGGAHANRIYRRDRSEVFQNGLWSDHVMGDSHYAGDYPVTPDLTNRVICDWAFDRKAGGRFFTGVLQTIQGCDAAEVDRPEGWANLAFSNFVQQCVSGPRISPDATMWAEARDAFFGQLSITRPRVLVVLGKRAWEQLPSDVGERVAPLLANSAWAPVEDAWMYPYWLNGRLEFTLAVWVYHPSSSKFNWVTASQRFTSASMLYDNLAISYREAMADDSEPPAYEPPSTILICGPIA